MAEELRRYVVGPDSENKEGKPLTRLIRLDEQDRIVPKAEADCIAKSSRDKVKFAIGHVYEIPVLDGKSFRIGSAKWLNQWVDKHRVTEWQAEQAGIENKRKAEKLEARMAKDDSQLAKQFEPFCEVYRRMTRADRIGFEVWLLTQLRKSIMF